MLVATPGQTASYSTLHNNSSNGTNNNNTATAASMTKKSATLNSANNTSSGTAKSINSNNHATSTVTTKNSLNSNKHSTTFNYQSNFKNDNIVSSKLSDQNKATTSSKEISSTKPATTTHSLKSENSTNTTATKPQSFIQTLKDSVQKALISTNGSNNIIANKHSVDKLKNNCNNSTTSTNNVTSSSSSTSHNANKVSTTTSSNTLSNSTAATQSLSSGSVMRGKHLSCSLSKLHTVAPTILHRYPEERQHASSTDSLQKEMCHFKPIRVVPKTPLKSGSKSRGSSLRFPKANLATKKTEFVLKSNCDVNNRKKRQQQNRTQSDKINVNGDDDNDNNEQENKDFHKIYKPKPSLTCLSTSFTSPNHQSAFVCLVAQMKNLVNLQSKRQLTPVKSIGTFVQETSAESLKELYVRKRQKAVKRQSKQEETPEQLPHIRSARLSSNAGKNKLVSNKATTQTVSKEFAKRSLAVTKAKSRQKLDGAKLKTNMIDLVKAELKNSFSMPALGAIKNKTKTTTTSLGARKSSRLSTSTISKTFKSPTNQTTVKSSQKSHKKPRSVVCFSPPLTRSRLKMLAEQGKILTTNTEDIKRRKI